MTSYLTDLLKILYPDRRNVIVTAFLKSFSVASSNAYVVKKAFENESHAILRRPVVSTLSSLTYRIP